MTKKTQEQKKLEHAERQKEWNELSLEEKIKELDRRPGRSAKQRKKLTEQLQKRNN